MTDREIKKMIEEYQDKIANLKTILFNRQKSYSKRVEEKIVKK